MGGLSVPNAPEIQITYDDRKWGHFHFAENGSVPAPTH